VCVKNYHCLAVDTLGDIGIIAVDTMSCGDTHDVIASIDAS